MPLERTTPSKDMVKWAFMGGIMPKLIKKLCEKMGHFGYIRLIICFKANIGGEACKRNSTSCFNMVFDWVYASINAPTPHL